MNRNFNFFEPYLIQKQKKTKKDHSGAFLAIIGIVVLALMITTSVYNFAMLSSHKKSLQQMDDMMNEKAFAEKYKNALAKETELNQIKQEKEFLEVIGASMSRIDRVNETLMNFIAGEVVDNLYLTKVDIKGQQLIIEGVSLNKLGIAQFEYDLRKNGDFQKIHVDLIKTREDKDMDGYEFKMSIDMGRVIPNENQ